MNIRENIVYGLLLAAVAGASQFAAAIGAGKGRMMAADTLAWEQVGQMKVSRLWGTRDEGAYGMMLRMPPGFKEGLHAHTADYHAVSLSGIWIHTMDGESKELPVGSYVMQPGGQFHADACKGPEECVLFFQQDGRGDFIPEKTP